MASIEEKVKSFLSNEQKASVIANDEKFLKEISDETATTETIIKKFGDVGLILSENEAKEIKEVISKIFNISLEKLGEIELKNISGGISDTTLGKLTNISSGITVASGTGGLSCWIASKICQSQAHKAMDNGEKSKSEKLTKAAKGLDIAAGTCIGLTLASGISSSIMNSFWEYSDKDQAFIQKK